MRPSTWGLGFVCVIVWSNGFAAPTYDVVEMGSTATERRYIDLNDSSRALAMQQDVFPQLIVTEDWSNRGQNYSQHRPGQLPGATETYAFAINNAGKIVGEAFFSGLPGPGQQHAFVYENGQFTDLHSAIGSGSERSSAAVDINSDGTVLGRYTDPQLLQRGFVYSGGQVSYIPLGDNYELGPAAINDSNQVAGVFTPPVQPGAPQERRVFLYENGTFNDLGNYYGPTGGGVQVTGIANTGEIIAAQRFGNHSITCYIRTKTDTRVIASSACAVLDINDAGTAVGYGPFDPSLTPRAFIYIDGSRVELKTLIDANYLAQNDLHLVAAVAINNKNEIIAYGHTGDGVNRYFLLVPQRTSSDDTAYYNFEQPNQTWHSQGDPIVSVGTSTAQAFAGASSLRMQFNGSGFVSIGTMYPPPLAGKTVTFHVFLPADALIEWVQPFVLEDYFGGWAWHGNWQPASNLQLGAWNTITLPIPANATAGYRIGVEFYTTQPYSGAVFIDSIGF